MALEGPAHLTPGPPAMSRLVDGEMADTADTVVSVPEIFDPCLQAGRTDAGFLGAPRNSTASAP